MQRIIGFGARIFLLLIVITACSCLSVIKHNEDMAAAKAIEFAQAAIIEKNYEKSLLSVLPERRQRSSAELIRNLITQLHPSSYPSKIVATDYESIPRQRAMKIYLVGENGAEKFYYVFLMEGTEDTGYGLVEAYRNLNPFPPTQLKKLLPVKRATGG